MGYLDYRLRNLHNWPVYWLEHQHILFSIKLTCLVRKGIYDTYLDRRFGYFRELNRHDVPPLTIRARNFGGTLAPHAPNYLLTSPVKHYHGKILRVCRSYS